MKITIKAEDSNSFLVSVSEGDSETTHKVNFSDDYWKQIGKGKSKEECIKLAFEFLLKREPKEAILRSFDMTVIKQYFPEFEREFEPI